MIKLAVGDAIPLELQLADGATSVFPQALLRNAAGALIATVSLTHVANGRYTDDSQAMPASAYVGATYLTYSDAGHTTLAGYDQVSDTFVRDAAVPAIAAAVAALPSAAQIAAAVLGATLEGGVTVARGLRGIARFLLARRSGYDTGHVAIRDLANTKDSIVIDVDGTGYTAVNLEDLD